MRCSAPAPLRAAAFALAAAAAGHAAARPAAAQVTVAGAPTAPEGSFQVIFPYLGVGIDVPGTTTYDQLTFNFLSYQDRTTPLAAGTAFLLSEPYSGGTSTTPNSLSPAAPGFIAASTGIVGGRYVFAPGVTVAGGQRYFLQVNGPVPDAAYRSTSRSDPGFLSAFGPDQSFQYIPFSTLYFHMQGVAVATVPEPGTWALLGTGLLAVGGARLRRRLAARRAR